MNSVCCLAQQGEHTVVYFRKIFSNVAKEAIRACKKDAFRHYLLDYIQPEREMKRFQTGRDARKVRVRVRWIGKR